MANITKPTSGWSGVWGRLVVLVLLLAGTAYTAHTNLQAARTQEALRNEMNMRLKSYVSKEQWEERWNGHLEVETTTARLAEQAMHTVTEAVTTINKSIFEMAQRTARMEAMMEAMMGIQEKKQ